MIWIWIAFVCFVLLMLALDLGVFHRQSHVVSMKEALGWSLVWVLLGIELLRVRLLRLREPLAGDGALD